MNMPDSLEILAFLQMPDRGTLAVKFTLNFGPDSRLVDVKVPPRTAKVRYDGFLRAGKRYMKRRRDEIEFQDLLPPVPVRRKRDPLS
jgi:hypothetical protein